MSLPTETCEKEVDTPIKEKKNPKEYKNQRAS